ncbi:hypothetical protein TR66_01680 [Streptomyces sp. WM6391]|nr:hypothetical protein TR66_01680 [Streptomyces sp. WM6391]
MLAEMSVLGHGLMECPDESFVVFPETAKFAALFLALTGVVAILVRRGACGRFWTEPNPLPAPQSGLETATSSGDGKTRPEESSPATRTGSRTS